GPSDDIHVLVTVRNVLGQGLAGANVVAAATPIGSATFRWDDGSLPPGDTPENPQTGVSDGLGHVEVIYNEGGGALPPTPLMPDLDFTVTTQGPGPGGPVQIPGCPTPFSIIGVDLNADGRVNLTDFAIFGTDYGAGNPRSDFNWDSRVNLTNFAMFSAHYLEN